MSFDRSALLAALAAAVGPANVLVDGDLSAWEHDWRRRWRGRALAVVRPGSTAEVAAVVTACAAHGASLVPQGGNTGLVGGGVPDTSGTQVLLSLQRMTRVRTIDTANLTITVDAGCVLQAVQEAAAAKGLMFPLSLAAEGSCTIGGNLATNAGGPRAVKYGATRDNVLGLVAVTGTGELIRVGGAYSKNSSGYDLTHLLVGSEGTLALIVEATLKLSPRPIAQAGLRAFYRDARSAAAAVSRLMAQPEVPAALEFMDRRSLELLRRNGSEIPEAGAMLLIEADGSVDTLPDSLAALGAAAEGVGLLDMDVALDGAARARLWAARRALSPALRTIAPGKLNEDVVVPVSRIPDLVAGVEALAAESALTIVSFGHAGNGNLHINILYHPDDADETARAQAALPRIFDLALALGGALSGEHGIGLSKRDFMAGAFDPATLATMRAVKAAFDPDGILNPGKLLPDAS